MTAAERSDGEGDGRRGVSASSRGRSALERGREWLDHVRTNPRAHRIALVLALAVGLVLAWGDWFGLVLGGALVGLVSPTGRRALVAGLSFGVLVLVAFAVTLGGDVGAALAMTPASYVTIGSALVLPVFGSLVRFFG